jgi:hypothetical protein
MKCRHCHRAPVSRPRALCWKCFYTPGVRDRYPTLNKYAQQGIADFYGRGHPPSAPTSALPGTPEKVAVLMKRAQLRQSLWHAKDARLDSPRLRRDQWPTHA